jgi:heptosyltransferase-2
VLYLSPEEEQDAERKLSYFGVRENEFLIALHPEAGYPSKEWGGDRFRNLIERLLARPRSKILILGTGNAQKIAEAFGSSSHVVNLVNVLTLREMICAMSRSHLFIGNDSGPSHIAQALGIPAVVIASGTNEYARWGIWAKPSRILKHGVPCSPCHLRDCNVEGHPCMSEISVEEVYRAVQELLSEVESCSPS